MAFAFVNSNNATGTGVTTLDCNLPAAITSGTLLVAVYAFENVAAGSGPWIIPNTGQLNPNGLGPAKGWTQACWQTPVATGVGIEVWCAIWSTGTHITANFTTSQNAVCVMGAWTGEYNPNGQITGAPPRLTPTLQVQGNQPPAPPVTPNVGELVVACAGDLMTASKFGTPSGFTNRVDVNRSGAGTVDATIADQTATLAANTGPITFPNNSTAASTAGATATLVFQPVPTVAGSGPILVASFPPDLDLDAGYQVRLRAVDPTTGAQVSGVTVSNFSLLVDDLTGGDGQGLEVGPFMLLPGPNA